MIFLRSNTQLLEARFETIQQFFRDCSSMNWYFTWADFSWAATMVTTRSVRASGIKLSKELLESHWFLSDRNHGKWSTEIALVPYFDFLIGIKKSAHLNIFSPNPSDKVILNQNITS